MKPLCSAVLLVAIGVGAGAEVIQLVPDPDFALAAALDCLAQNDAACAERALDDLPAGTDPEDPVLRLIRDRIARLGSSGPGSAAAESNGGPSEAAAPSAATLTPSGYAPDDPRLLRLVRIDRTELDRSRGSGRGRRPAELAPATVAALEPAGGETIAARRPPDLQPAAAPPADPAAAQGPSSTGEPSSESQAESAPKTVAQALNGPPPMQPIPPRGDRPQSSIPARPGAPEPDPAPAAPQPSAAAAAAVAARPMIALELKDGSRVVVKELAFRATGSDGSLQAPLPGAAFSTSRGIIVLRWESMEELRILDQQGTEAGPLARVFLTNGESIQLGLVSGVVSGARPNPPGGEFSTSIHDLVAILLPR